MALPGPVFGAGVFFAMRLMVLPMSACPHPVTFEPLAIMLDLLSYMLLSGLPITSMVVRGLRGPAPA